MAAKHRGTKRSKTEKRAARRAFSASRPSVPFDPVDRTAKLPLAVERENAPPGGEGA